MIEISFPEASTLKNIVASLKELVTKITMDIDDKGLHVQAMDAANVALVSAEIDQLEKFDNYRCDKNVTIGLDLEIFDKILKLADSREKLSLELSDDEPAEISIIIEHLKGARTTSRYAMSLLDLEVETLGVPEMEYSWVGRLKSSEYLSSCDSLLKINDFIEVKFASQKLAFSNDGEICKHAKIEYDCDGETVDPDDWYDFKGAACSSILKTSSGSMSYNFSAKYLRCFAKAGCLSEFVLIHMHEDVPLLVEYSIDGFGSLKYYLAPKQDDDEDDEGEGGSDDDTAVKVEVTTHDD